MLENLSKDELIQMIMKLRIENEELKEKVYGKQLDVAKDTENSLDIERSLSIEKTLNAENQLNEEKPLKFEKTIKNSLSKEFSIEEKVKIFMQVFNGRTDVYAKRWTSTKTGKSGYSPICKNEFSMTKCDKARIKCNECPYRELMPLTEDVILKHLRGDITVGIYPLLPGDLCNFLAIDFDKNTYKSDVIEFWNICDSFGIPIYVERSRSGNGAHIWIFFEESISAKVARKMGNILLTKTMEKKSLDLESYDRLLPNQDTMPKGGFGNLIALPFQGESSKKGNTVFVNKDFEVQENQLNILVDIKRLKIDEIYDFINKYKDDDFDENEIAETLDDETETIKMSDDENEIINISEDEIPREKKLKDIVFTNNIECIFDNKIYIKKINLLPNEITYLKRLASFTNPKFYEMQKLRMPIFYKTTPRIIACFEENDRFLMLPRGCIDKIIEICNKSNVKLILKDTREAGITTNYVFSGKLNSKQEKAKNELLKYEMGVLCAATGFGKTVIAANIISDLKTSTLIIVNRNNLLEQWKERLSYFLNISKKEIGQIGASKDEANGKLDVASFQSLFKKDNLGDVVKNYGLVIVDECHHVAAFSFENVLKAIKSKYVYGLTATPTRKDGLHKIIYMQCGNIRVRITNHELKQNKEFEHIVITRKTNYEYISNTEKDKISISEILNDMCHNFFRNRIIIEDIKKAILEGRTPIVLTERIEHLKILKEHLQDLNVPIVIYKGNMGKKEMRKINDIIKEADESNKPRIILATSSTIGEGFDDSRLDTLFLTMPVSWKGRIIQYVGRLHREHDNKEKVIVYDYLDNMKVLGKMYERRMKGYKMAGYEMLP